jgi:exodeoxyribonuclease VII large subunit
MATPALTLTVSQLTRAIKYQLEHQFSFVVVEGEVSNFKQQISNHLYFTLKDSEAQIQCVMFSSEVKGLKQLPKAGDQVLIKGELSVYPPRGNYQIIVRSLQPAGLGELLILLEKRKNKYRELGWFDSSLKKPLPKYPKRIGVVSSPTGAVICDIIQILKRRANRFHLLLNPVKVQGVGAKEEISSAIDDFNTYNLVDLIIVARGGGSMEDLWPFNEECVIESIHRSKIPIITAIGHETDTTLADLVADLRAPTPSAAAELALEEEQKKVDFLNLCELRLTQSLHQSVQRHKEKIAVLLHHPFLTNPRRLLTLFQQQLDDKIRDLDQIAIQLKHRFALLVESKKRALQNQNPHLKIKNALYRLDIFQQNIRASFLSTLQTKKSNLTTLVTHLGAINPKKVLEKGYSILFDEKKKSVILSVEELSLKQNIKLLLKDGIIKAQINEIETSPACKK